MIDINFLRNEAEKVKQGIASKKIDSTLVDKFLELDKKWRRDTTELDSLRAKQNKLGKDDIEEAKKIKEEAKKLELEVKDIENERVVILEQIPNVPSKDVPIGKDDTENVVLREVGEKRNFDFTPLEYLDVAKNLIDTKKASEVASSRFSYIFGDLVLLEFALLKLAFDKLTAKGFIPVVPPVFIKPDVMKGMGKNKFLEEEDVFYISQDDMYLVGSSEHTIGPFHMNEVFDEKDLPRRYIGFSTSFRREAGSYGKDTKGILRVHQFDKAEMFSFAKPEDSEEEHEFLLLCQEELMQSLKLPYRVMKICTGDMGFGDYKQYDIETWLPGQNKYRETNSCSNTTDFQSRGINIKYKNREKSTAYVHTLNGTAFAMGRMIIAIIENYQTKTGTIIVPEVLRGYVGKDEIKL